MSGVCHVNIRWCVMCNVSQMFSFFCHFQSLQNSQGQQREFGDGQRDQKKNSSPSASDEDNVILNSIKNRGIHGQEFRSSSSSSLAIRIIWVLGQKRTEGPAAQIVHSRLSHQMLLISHWFSKPVNLLSLWFFFQVTRRICFSWVLQPSMPNGSSAPCSVSPARNSVPRDPAQPAELQPLSAVSTNSQQRAPMYKNQR